MFLVRLWMSPRQPACFTPDIPDPIVCGTVECIRQLDWPIGEDLHGISERVVVDVLECSSHLCNRMTLYSVGIGGE
jgi:hypothetical protein